MSGSAKDAQVPFSRSVPLSILHFRWPEICSHTCEGVKKSKQLIRRLTDKGAKKRKVELLSFLCDFCVLCALA
jgi:hypothetical protein